MKIEIYEIDNLFAKQLNSECYLVYKTIVKNISEGIFSMTFSVDNPDNVAKNFKQILHAVVYGNPEIFFIEQNFPVAFEGNNINLNIRPYYPVETLCEKYNELMNEVNRIAEIIDRKPTIIEKLERLNSYLTMRIEGISSMEHEYGNAFGALINKHARCEGYAKAAVLIMRKLNIKSGIIVGKATYRGQEEEHAWNVAEVNGKNYYFDFTWNARLSCDQKIAVPLYMFFDRKTISIDHETDMTSENDNDSSLIFYNRNDSVISNLTELDNVKQFAYSNSFFSIVKMPFQLTPYEAQYDLPIWINNSIGSGTNALYTSCVYMEKLQVAIIYFLNS